MTSKKLLSIIEKGESLTVEFKQRFSTHRKIAKEFIALANTSGGKVLFGVDDDGSIYGVESEKGESELINEVFQEYCEPKIEYEIDLVELFGKDIIVVTIEESNIKPHRIQDYKKDMDLNSAEVFVRINDKSVPASKEMIKIFQASYNNKRLVNYAVGKIEKSVFKYLENNESIKVAELAEVVNISNRRASRTLIKMVRANLLTIHIKENGESYFTSL